MKAMERITSILWFLTIWSLVFSVILAKISVIVYLAAGNFWESWEGLLASMLLSSVIWLLFFALFVKHFILTITEAYHAQITVDFLSGKLRTYSKGINLIRPWELVKPQYYYKLKVETVSINGTFATKDGGKFDFEGSFGYEPSVERLVVFVGTDESTIRIGLVNLILGIVSEEVAKRKTEEALRDIDLIKQNISNRFGGIPKDQASKITLGIQNPNTRLHQFETDFGININFIAAQKLLPSPDTQKELDKKFRAYQQKEVADTLHNLTKEQMDAVLINQGDLKKTVTEVNINAKGLENLAPILDKLAIAYPAITKITQRGNQDEDKRSKQPEK